MRRKMEKLAEKLNGNVMYLTENPFGVDIGFYDDCKYFLCWQNTHRVFKAFETQKETVEYLEYLIENPIVELDRGFINVIED